MNPDLCAFSFTLEQPKKSRQRNQVGMFKHLCWLDGAETGKLLLSGLFRSYLLNTFI